jgi:hypothetical protein
LYICLRNITIHWSDFAVLDPRISYKTLQDNYTDDNDLLAHLEASKLDLQSHFEIHYAQDRCLLVWDSYLILGSN